MADAAPEATVPPGEVDAAEPMMSGALPPGEGANNPETTTDNDEAAGNGTGESPKEAKAGDKLRHNDWREMRDRDQDRDRYSNKRGNYNKRPYQGNNKARERKEEMKKNIKSEFNQAESSDPDAIRKQVEFYFSDSNLPSDNFLLGKVEGAKNNPVDISVLHSFKRMRHFQPFSAVVAALKESKTLDVVDGDKVKRKVPLSDKLFNEQGRLNKQKWDDLTRARSIYAKGFGEEGPSTQFDIEAFFAPYGPTNAIRLRRKQQNMVFKGSVFAEFDSEETAKAFLNLENKPKWKGNDLVFMSKEDYVKMKEKDNDKYDRYTDEYHDENASQDKKRNAYKHGKSSHSRSSDNGRDRRDRRDSSKRKLYNDYEDDDVEPKRPRREGESKQAENGEPAES